MDHIERYGCTHIRLQRGPMYTLKSTREVVDSLFFAFHVQNHLFFLSFWGREKGQNEQN